MLFDKNIKSTSFEAIRSPIDEHESLFRKSRSPDSSSLVNNNNNNNNNNYNNSPTPSSHLSVVNPERLSPSRSLSPPVSNTLSPLFGSRSLNDPFRGSISPLLNASPLPFFSTPPLNGSPVGLSPISDLGSPVGSISLSLWFSDEYITSELLRKGKFNTEFNTIELSKIDPRNSLLLPNFKLVGLYYIDPSSSESFTFFNFTLINQFEVKSMYIPEICKYYDPINSI